MYEVTIANNFWEMVTKRVELSPNEVAFEYYKNEMIEKKTFSEFKNDICRIADFLKLDEERQRVALVGSNSYSYIVTYFAVMCSGSVIIPIDKERVTSDFLLLLKDSKATLIVYDDGVDEFIEEARNNLNMNNYILLSEISNLISKNNPEDMLVTMKTLPNDDDDALLLYTSGTTGNCKGVALKHKNVCNDVMSVCQVLYLKKKTMLVLPLHHVYGLLGLCTVFHNGATTFINTNRKKLMNDIKVFQPEQMIVVPLYVENIYKLIKATLKKMKLSNQFQLSDVRGIISNKLNTIISGGAILNPEYIEFFRDMGIELLNGYGITECSGVITVNTPDHKKNGSVGKAIPGCEVKIDFHKNHVGEILVRGNNVIEKYYQNEEANKESFIDGWYRTGDLGYYDNDGFLFICGRLKNLIICSNGENVCPEELEGIISNIEIVNEVIVSARDNQYISAEIFPNYDLATMNGITEIHTYLVDEIDKINQKLPSYKQISKVLLRIEGFPKNSSMKILRYKRSI